MGRKIVSPDGFSDYAWEVEAKGVPMGASIDQGGRTVEVTFYEPTRLGQDVEEDVRRDGVTTLSRVVVVPKVTEVLIIEALSRPPDSFFG